VRTAIGFNHVYKRYHLGAGTASLRDALPNALGRLLKRRAPEDRQDQTLWALRDVSFTLERGQALGIIGPNGAGKTTILKLLSNITQPTRGSIDVDGRLSALIELGAGFHPDLTGRENLYLNAAILGISRREMETKFESIVEFSGLHDFMDTPVKRYSSGMYVRLGFSIAAHVEPDVLLVDEVLAVGDAFFRRKCIERVHHLRQQGTTIVFVSHIMNLVRSVCDRGLFLQNGQTQVYGSATEAIRAYEASLHHQKANAATRLNPPLQSLGVVQSPIEIQSVELLNGSNRLVDHCSYADDIRVRVSYRARELVRSPSLVARIIRSDGTTCCEIRTRNDETWLPDLEGSGHLSFSIEPIQLASGAYMMEVQLQDTADVVPLAVGQSDWLHVSGPGVTVVYEYGGVYVPRVRWGFASDRQSVGKDRFIPVRGNDS
jgi:lipopolysaccharide transport system ATP-binding protein